MHRRDPWVGRKRTTTVIDFSGGLNLSDPPLELKQNQLLEATNWQYSEVGDGIETRDGVFLNVQSNEMVYDSLMGGRATFIAVVNGMLVVSMGKIACAYPSLLRHYEPHRYRCSDFTWTRLGLWNCSQRYDETCDMYSGEPNPLDIPDFSALPIAYEPTYYEPTYLYTREEPMEPIGAAWGDRKREFLIADGGKLKHFREMAETMEELSNSPYCSYVTKHSGRVVVNDLEHPSRLVFSGVGDANNWKQSTEDGWTEADSLWIDIGYKSGGDICAIATLSKDLIIWKTNGTVYRLTGTYPDWAVYEIGRNCWIANGHCTVEVGGDLFFIDQFFGFSSIQTVMQYGEMRAGTIGYEINKALVAEMDVDARMWSVPSRGEVWVKPRLGAKKVYVFNVRRRAWTVFEFPHEVDGAASVGNWTYVSFIPLVTDEYYGDFLIPLFNIMGDHGAGVMNMLGEAGETAGIDTDDIYSDILWV